MTKLLWVIAPHMDDEVLSFGGLIRRRVEEGWRVHVSFMFDRKYFPLDPQKTERQHQHMRAAMETLGVEDYSWYPHEEGEPAKVGHYALLNILEDEYAQLNPDMIAIPGRNDLNQDHRHLYEICRILLRPGNRPYKKLTVLESIAPDHMQPVEANYGLIVTSPMLKTIQGAMICYEDEVRPDPHPRSLLNLEARYRFWGAQFGYKFVEPYRLVSEVD